MRPANGGRPVLILGPGSLVGVQELIGQRPCRLEAVADSAVEVLSISHERLQKLPGSEEFSTSLQALVELPGLGRVYRSRQIRNGEPAVISDYSGLPGGPLRVQQIPNRRRIEATRSLANAETRHWQSPDKQNELLVEASSGRLLGLAMHQDWPHLSDLMGVLLRDIPLTAMQLQAFSASGQLLLEAPEEQIEGGSHMICACTGTTSTALREAAQHSDTLAGLQQLTAAGTVYGGCLHRLPSFLNQAIEVRLCRLSLHSLASGSMTVRLKPIEPSRCPVARRRAPRRRSPHRWALGQPSIHPDQRRQRALRTWDQAGREWHCFNLACASRRATWCASVPPRAICCLRRTTTAPCCIWWQGSVSRQRLPAGGGWLNSAGSRWPTASAVKTRRLI